MDIFIAKSSRFWHNWDRQDRNASDENIADHNMEYRCIDRKGARCMKLQANIQTEALLEASGDKKRAVLSDPFFGKEISGGKADPVLDRVRGETGVRQAILI